MAELIVRQMSKKEQAKRIAEANRRLKAKRGSHSGKATLSIRDGVITVRERIDGQVVVHRSDGPVLSGQGMTKRKFRPSYREL